MTIPTSEMFPQASQFIGGAFHESWEQESLDPDEAVATTLRTVIVHEKDPELQLLKEQLARLRQSPEGIDMAWFRMGGVPPYVHEDNVDPWLDYVDELVAHGEQPDLEADARSREWRPPKPPRASRFTDEKTANKACTLVLRANQDLGRRFDSGELGLKRLHLYADLGRAVGQIVTPDGDLPARAAVVILRKQPETGQTYISTAYPETHLDPEIRAVYPMLPHLLGGHFGQDWPQDDGSVWMAEVNFHLGASPHAQRLIRGQLDQLLATTSDADLPHAVEALGSYVLPGALRQWLTRILRRMDMPQLWGRPTDG